MSDADDRDIWDAINEYVVTCAGDPSKHVYGNTPRQVAVARVEKARRSERQAAVARIAELEAKLAVYEAATAVEFPGYEVRPRLHDDGTWLIHDIGQSGRPIGGPMPRDVAVARAYELSKRKESEG